MFLKLFLKLFLVIILVFVNISIPTLTVDASNSSIQTIELQVETEDININPGVYWWQEDDGTFSAEYYGASGYNKINVPMAGSNQEPYPSATVIRDRVNLLNYQNPIFKDFNTNQSYNINNVENVCIKSVSFREQSSFSGRQIWFESGTQCDREYAEITTETGFGYTTTDYRAFGMRPNGFPKYEARYDTPLSVRWKGVVKETKQIQVLEDSIIKVGQSKAYQAQVRTRAGSNGQWGNYINVSTRPETEWSTDRQAVATVDQNGRVTGHTVGTATISARWKSADGKYNIVASAKVTVTDEDVPPVIPPGGGSCPPPSHSGPSRGSQVSAEVMNPSATGVIKADTRGSERFDVLQGIPTSESLYTNAFGQNYLFQHRFVQMQGTYTFSVEVQKTYILEWTETEEGEPEDPEDPESPPTVIETPMSEEETVVQVVQVERPYSYWIIDNLEVYGLERATMSNYALPGEIVTMSPSGYTAPSVDAVNNDNHDDHVQVAECNNVDLGTETLNGGDSRPDVPSEDFTSEAQDAVGQIQAKNDKVTFNGSPIMQDSWAVEHAPAPGRIPNPSIIGENVLYSPNNMISSSLLNKANTTSTGTIFYNLIKGIKGGSPKQFPINGINTVTVHTPTVNYSSVSDDREHNQKTRPSYNRSALILERPFVVTIPTSGQHRNIPGYGDRDYAKYIRDKQVLFPFDVYNGTQTQFIPANTWISIPVSQIDTTFYLPVWVDEGNYDVLFRSFAENSPSSGFTTQSNANLDLTHHVSTQTIPVEVIGRVYDFRITDIADYNWEDVFRIQKGSATHTGAYYWVQDRSIDGAPRGNTSPYMLPILPGSHPSSGKKNISVKTGYHFKFNLKTKGNMFGRDDAIHITPTFYFVQRDGSRRQEVDLYYHTNDQFFVKIGGPEDVERRHVTLNTRLRNVPQQEMIDAAHYVYDHYANTNLPRNQFVEQYLKDSAKPTWVGKYDWMILPYQVRTFIGPKNVPSGASATQQRANASIQTWYGEYSLPAAAFAVPKGTNIAEYGRTNRLTDKSPIFLRNGYIIVNFDIETIRNRDLLNPHLQYMHGPLNNQWRKEGYKGQVTDSFGNTFQLLDGDVIFYHGDKSSYDDFGSSVTH